MTGREHLSHPARMILGTETLDSNANDRRLARARQCQQGVEIGVQCNHNPVFQASEFEYFRVAR